MPPKVSKKNANAAKAKIVEDKTFGLKNKKGAKVGKYVEQVKQAASRSGDPRVRKQVEEANALKAAKKQAEIDKKAELAMLFKSAIVQPKLPFGTDPKTVLCAFFKAGLCQKGIKCKFSHDLNVERKERKIDLYTDTRAEKEKDTMDGWDQNKLESVVSSKKQTNKPTDIVCKYFIEAIEDRKYGWFWNCPNGNNDCKYRHALPEGYVLRKRETEEERREREEQEKANEITIEDFLEKARHNLGPNLTPITYETFQKWKDDRNTKAKQEQEAIAKKKRDEYLKIGGKTGLAFSGRELFDYNPDWAVGKDDEDGLEYYEREESDGEQETKDENSSTSPNQQLDEEVKVEESLFADEDLEGLSDDDE